MNNPYETLNIKDDATADEIKAAYRKRANETHPDKGGDSGAFLAVSAAYQLLSDPKEREFFDRTGEQREKLNLAELAKKTVGVAVQEVIIGNFNAKTCDLIDATRGRINTQCREKVGRAEQEKRNLERRRDKFREAIDRTVSNDPQNILVITMERAELELSNVIRGIEDDIRTEQLIRDLALSILDDYHYMFEVVDERGRLDAYFRTGFLGGISASGMI